MNIQTDWPNIARATAEIVSAFASIFFFVLLLRKNRYISRTIRNQNRPSIYQQRLQINSLPE